MNLTDCTLCPRSCHVDRAHGQFGFCGSGLLPAVAKAYPHHWEEPCISGTRGSGTVFFTGCSLRCAFCQNAAISRRAESGTEVSIKRLSEIFLDLQRQGVHNINLVNPTHHAHAVLESLEQVAATVIASSGVVDSSTRDVKLQIPVVWNSGGYDAVETIRAMSGHVSVWLPDLKFQDSDLSRRMAAAPDYFERATAAIREMARLAGKAVFDEEGLMQRGLLIRHLVLPGHTLDSVRILEWIAAEFGASVPVSLMSQYTPMDAPEAPNRKLSRREYDRVVEALCRLGLENGYVQERTAAGIERIPDFDGEGVLNGTLDEAEQPQPDRVDREVRGHVNDP